MQLEIDRYVIEAELGRGAFGAVYLARHKILGARVALKLLHPSQVEDAIAVDRFLREARAAATIGNAHIVRVSDAGVTPQQHVFLAMELLEGEDLASYLKRCGRLSAADAVAIVLQVLDGLAAAHAVGIVHRDMKPANVFLTRDERGALLVKVLDFGVSKIQSPVGIDGSLTATGMIVGTPHYMAPEQLIESKSVDARADLYSIGVMLYEMLSGALPYDAESYGMLFKEVLTSSPKPLSSIAPYVPASLVAVVEQSLAKEPGHRAQSAGELAYALRAALESALPDRLSVPPTLASPMPPASAIQPRWQAPAIVTAPMREPAPPANAPPPKRSRASIALAVVGLVALGCACTGSAAMITMQDRFAAAWAAFMGQPSAPAREPDVDEETPAIAAPPPEIPMHDGTEEDVGGAAISIERCSRRRADNGRWLVDMPVRIRNVGESGLVFQQSEITADGYVSTAESDFPTMSIFAPGHSIDGYLVFRAQEDIPPPETITVRFRGWVRRVPVTDGPRLPPRPAPE